MSIPVVRRSAAWPCAWLCCNGVVANLSITALCLSLSLSLSPRTHQQDAVRSALAVASWQFDEWQSDLVPIRPPLHVIAPPQHARGIDSPGAAHIAHSLLTRERCHNGGAWYLEIAGGSSGQLATMAMMRGCVARVFEPGEQDPSSHSTHTHTHTYTHTHTHTHTHLSAARHVSLLKHVADLNNITDVDRLLQVREALPSHANASTALSVSVPSRDCFACTQVQPSDDASDDAAARVRLAPLVDDDRPTRVLLAVVACAGYEATALRALLDTSSLQVDNILLTLRSPWSADALAALDAALQRGYAARWLPLHWVSSGHRRVRRWYATSAAELFAGGGSTRSGAVQRAERGALVRSAAAWGDVSWALVPLRSAEQLLTLARSDREAHVWLSSELGREL